MKPFLLSLFGILLVFSLFLLFGQLTNPYSKLTIIRSPFQTEVDKNGNIVLKQISPVHFTDNFLAKKLAEMNKASRFVVTTLFPEKPLPGNEKEIIAQIYKQSFDPTKPYVISGTHFSDIYVRNLGIFYNALLDNRVAIDKTDWLNRQRAAIQSLALNLELFRLSGKEYTTFIPLIGTSYTSSNVYTDPSDSLFGVLYLLSAAKDETFIHTLFPSAQEPLYPLQTKKAAEQLLMNYKKPLQNAVVAYQNSITDKQTGLIRKDITLSSARDGIKRQSSFYDNVILWTTIEMAQNLGILTEKQDLQAWKQKIISAFWDEQTGIFLDDLSDESKKEKRFSGDIFIVTGSGFFDWQNADDKRKLSKMIMYVEKNKLDQPFPLFYAKKDDPNNLYWAVKTFAPSYMGETIWSHWGMEYIKTLIILSKDEPPLIHAAARHMDAYKNAIEKNGGYPELYDKTGNLYVTPLYRSILHTSWVINYEQAAMLFHEASSL